MTTHALWGDSKPPEPTPPLPPNKARRFANETLNGFSIDIHGWLAANEPQQYSELMDLRIALYSRRSRRKYGIGHYGIAGEDSFVVFGAAGSLLIRHDKARYYLLRELSRLRRAKRWPPIKYKR
jgi:hypothetical protein